MGIFIQPNVTGLRKYLSRFGIEIDRVAEANLDESGYDYIAQFPDGRPVYHNGFQLTYDRRSWPSPEVYDNVLLLLKGGSVPDDNDTRLIVGEQPVAVELQERPVTPKPAVRKPRTVKKVAK
jgi:hypothetical protein